MFTVEITFIYHRKLNTGDMHNKDVLDECWVVDQIEQVLILSGVFKKNLKKTLTGFYDGC